MYCFKFDSLEAPQCQTTGFPNSFSQLRMQSLDGFLANPQSTLGCGSSSLNHVSISTKFLPNSLRIKGGPGTAEGDRDMVNAVFSWQGLCRSPSTRKNYWTNVQAGRKRVDESQPHLRTQKLSFCVYIFKMQKSKKGWHLEVPGEPKSLTYIPQLCHLKPLWARRSKLTLLPRLQNKSTYFVCRAINCVQVS